MHHDLLVQANELASAKSARMLDKPTKVYAGIGAEIGMALRAQARGEFTKIRAMK